MKGEALIRETVETVCELFERGDYNPTAIIDLGVLVANADGTIDDDEVEALRLIFGRLLRTQLDVDLVSPLIVASREVIDAAGVGSRLRLIAEILKDCDAVEEGVIVALGIAYSSEGFSASERTLIGSLAQACNLPSSRLEELIETVRLAVEAP
ncbi:TerB family tellurite resistance protein [Pendulispora rubella]|uniref:TerB family tellurite resistance protein n=1 Tax=Pendulispora rubella TaxID=2741070 RepID=A0ABZ2L067_9BACT